MLSHEASGAWPFPRRHLAAGGFAKPISDRTGIRVLTIRARKKLPEHRAGGAETKEEAIRWAGSGTVTISKGMSPHRVEALLRGEFYRETEA